VTLLLESIMKIGSLENQAAASPAVNERKAMPTAPAAAAAAEPSAQVALSPAVAQLASSESVFDADKVKRISDAIRDGKFTVDPEAIADKLISNAQELLGNVQKR
jgi:negative regulator of flagellin synthesis FlgM